MVYDYPAALRVGRAAEALNFYWYEDPLHYTIDMVIKLKQVLQIPIMATEMPSTTHFLCAMGDGASDRLPRGDVAIKGGLISCLKTAHMAEAFQMNYEVHHGEIL